VRLQGARGMRVSLAAHQLSISIRVIRALIMTVA
jgi:hypothetical protein